MHTTVSTVAPGKYLCTTCILRKNSQLLEAMAQLHFCNTGKVCEWNKLENHQDLVGRLMQFYLLTAQNPPSYYRRWSANRHVSDPRSTQALRELAHSLAHYPTHSNTLVRRTSQSTTHPPDHPTPSTPAIWPREESASNCKDGGQDPHSPAISLGKSNHWEGAMRLKQITVSCVGMVDECPLTCVMMAFSALSWAAWKRVLMNL